LWSLVVVAVRYMAQEEQVVSVLVQV